MAPIRLTLSTLVVVPEIYYFAFTKQPKRYILLYSVDMYTGS